MVYPYPGMPAGPSRSGKVCNFRRISSVGLPLEIIMAKFCEKKDNVFSSASMCSEKVFKYYKEGRGDFKFYSESKSYHICGIEEKGEP